MEKKVCEYCGREIEVGERYYRVFGGDVMCEECYISFDDHPDCFDPEDFDADDLKYGYWSGWSGKSNIIN